MSIQEKVTRRKRLRKLILFLIELAVLVVVIVLLVFYNRINSSIDVQDVDGSKITVNDVEEETLVEFLGTETIAIFGLDNRDLGEYDYGNTDLIMIMNIDNDTGEIAMVSVYRDTYLNIATAGQAAKYEKANAAYANGGASQAINMLNQNLDLDIDNYISVDFQAVSEAIDILGGIEIEIESEYELQYLNDYILATNDILGTNSPTISSTGVHLMDGTQAVAYSRIRYTSGGDYKRAQRQRIVISEMLDKAKDANLSQLTELINMVFDDISTDMSQRELLSLATSILSYDISESQGFPFDRTDAILEGVVGGDIVVPCTLESNVSKLHEVLFGTEDYTPSPQVQAYSQYIEERTGKTEADAYTDQFAESDNYDGEYDEEYEYLYIEEPDPFAQEEEEEEEEEEEGSVDTSHLFQ